VFPDARTVEERGVARIARSRVDFHARIIRNGHP
jgi:hypothetical protein